MNWVEIRTNKYIMVWWIVGGRWHFSGLPRRRPLLKASISWSWSPASDSRRALIISPLFTRSILITNHASRRRCLWVPEPKHLRPHAHPPRLRHPPQLPLANSRSYFRPLDIRKNATKETTTAIRINCFLNQPPSPTPSLPLDCYLFQLDMFINFRKKNIKMELDILFSEFFFIIHSSL